MTGLSFVRRVSAVLPLLLSAGAAAAPVPAASNATGKASILKSLSVLKQADLDFGNLVVRGAGTAVIDPVSGAVSATGLVTPTGVGAHQATFVTTGSRNSVINIRIPQKPITLTRTGGTETVSVSSWTLDGSQNRKIPLSSTINFGVGATVTVAAGQAEGTYTGTFDVTVQYP
jgi:hypothetical protein